MGEGALPASRSRTLGWRPVAAGRPPARRSSPVRLVSAAIGLDADVCAVGLRADGELDLAGSGEVIGVAGVSGPGEVIGAGGAAAPGATGTVAWYQGSPTPGETGSAVLVGPVDGVFHGLRLLRPGDRVEVRRADDSDVPFVVTGIARYPADHVPADRMAGPPDHPALILMTCGGAPHGGNLIAFCRRDES